MVDVENRVIGFGDGTLKVAFNPFGMMFGRIDTPEDVFETSMFIAMSDIPDFYDKLADMESTGELEHTFNQTVFKFKSTNDIKMLKRSVLIWGASLSLQAEKMGEYIIEKLAADFPDIDIAEVLGNGEE